LHRRIIQSLGENSQSYMLFICRSAAKTRLISAMDFVNRLRPEHLQSFWYFPSRINFTLIGTFGGLLWATAPAQEEANFYKSRLSEYRWTLSVSARRAKFLEYAVQMLDASRAMLRNMAQKPLLKQQVSTTGVPRGAASPVGVNGHSAISPPIFIEEDEDDDDDEDDDVEMEDAPGEEDEEGSRSITRATSASNISGSIFSGFSDGPLDSFGRAVGGGQAPTPPSSTGGV
jgi:hypothetical protein